MLQLGEKLCAISRMLFFFPAWCAGALCSWLVARALTMGARVSSPALIMVVSFLVVGGDDGVGETAGGDTRAPNITDGDVRVPKGGSGFLEAFLGMGTP